MSNPFDSEEWQKMSETFNQAMKEYESESEKVWNSLSYEDQLKVFCAVVRRIYDGEIVKRRSYRGVLYDVFQFGPDAYVAAQVAGYMEIHNAIYTSEELNSLKNQ